jgi:L-amino acid N-acyltransferase YncA
MTEIALRPATPADIPAITRIYAHAVIHGTASFELEPPDETEMTRRMQAMLSGGFPYIVAENAGALMGQAILGYAYAGPYRTRPAYRFTVEDSIYVDPNAHRRGIGRVLLACLIEESESRGFRQMLAVIGDSAQTPSIQVHRALGFRMVGSFENVGFKFGRWLDSVLMQRDLGPGATTQP